MGWLSNLATDSFRTATSETRGRKNRFASLTAIVRAGRSAEALWRQECGDSSDAEV
jgi:hypothetical protein